MTDSRRREEVLRHWRARYGAEIVATLWRQLSAEFAREFEEKNLRRMLQFAGVFPDRKVVVSLIRHST